MNEISLPYVEQGDASGVPVLMLHGGTDSWRSFEPVLPHLPDDIRAVAVTMRGHGDAPKPESGYRVEDLAGDVIALMEELDLGAGVLVGHSMGTMVAQRIAIEAPERVLGLVLGGAFGQPQANSPGLLELRAEFGEIEDPVARELAHEFQASTTARPLDPDQLAVFVDETRKVPARVWREIFSAFPEVDYAAELAALAPPALIVQGGRDEMIPPKERHALLGLLPGARLIVYEGAGHALHWEQPERFAADIVEFSRLASSRSKPRPHASAA
jgi:pimeloyl-ACP methyl ester carboxylesterase